MKRILTTIIAAALAILCADAQTKFVELGGFYQTGLVVHDQGVANYPYAGASFQLTFNPSELLPVYVGGGLDAMFSIKRGGTYTPASYRFQVPVIASYQIEPSPTFSFGPYVGVFGALNALVDDGSFDKTAFNKLQWGFLGGISIRPGSFFINAGYYHDMNPFFKGGRGVDGWRFSVGMLL